MKDYFNEVTEHLRGCVGFAFICIGTVAIALGNLLNLFGAAIAGVDLDDFADPFDMFDE